MHHIQQICYIQSVLNMDKISDIYKESYVEYNYVYILKIGLKLYLS